MARAWSWIGTVVLLLGLAVLLLQAPGGAVPLPVQPAVEPAIQAVADVGDVADEPAAAPDEAEHRTRVGGEAAMARIAGIVVRADGVPLAGALVGAAPTDGLRLKTLHARTDADGRFWFDGLVAGRWSLWVVGLERRDGEIAVELPPGAVRDVTLQTSATAIVWGVVRLGGEPAANRQLFLAPQDAAAGRRVATAHTDAEGIYRCAVTSGDYTVRVLGAPRFERERRGAVETWANVPGPLCVEAPVRVDASVREVRRDLDLPACRVTARVAAAGGAAVGRARVVLRWADAAVDWALETTEGAVAFDLLPFGAGECWVEQFGRPESRRQAVTLSPAQPAVDLAFELAAAGVADVRLFDEGGRPLLWRSGDAAAVTHLATGAVDRGQPLPASAEVRVRSFFHCGAGECVFETVDDAGPGWVRYGALATPRVPFAVPADGSAEVEVHGARRRARATFGCRAAPAAAIAVERVDDGLAVRPRMAATTWLGWLTPGRYRVTAMLDGMRRQHLIDVGGADVEHWFVP